MSRRASWHRSLRPVPGPGLVGRPRRRVVSSSEVADGFRRAGRGHACRHGARTPGRPSPDRQLRPGGPRGPGAAGDVVGARARALGRRHRASTALEFFGATTSHAALGRQVDRAAEGLRRLGARRGDRVAIVLPNCSQHVVAFCAVLRLGAVVVEHHPLCTAPELRHQFEDHRARVAIVWDRPADRVRSLPADLPVDAVVSVDITAAMPRAKRWALRLPLPRARDARAQLTGPAPGHDPLAGAAGRRSDDRGAPTTHDLALLQYASGTTGLPEGGCSRTASSSPTPSSAGSGSAPASTRWCTACCPSSTPSV
ncbi:UNVERIFIED_CONTAM: AMP-binding protein [Kocuria sp. CPCC 205315]